MDRYRRRKYFRQACSPCLRLHRDLPAEEQVNSRLCVAPSCNRQYVKLNKKIPSNPPVDCQHPEIHASGGGGGVNPVLLEADGAPESAASSGHGFGSQEGGEPFFRHHRDEADFPALARAPVPQQISQAPGVLRERRSFSAKQHLQHIHQGRSMKNLAFEGPRPPRLETPPSCPYCTRRTHESKTIRRFFRGGPRGENSCDPLIRGRSSKTAPGRKSGGIMAQ